MRRRASLLAFCEIAVAGAAAPAAAGTGTTGAGATGAGGNGGSLRRSLNGLAPTLRRSLRGLGADTPLVPLTSGAGYARLGNNQDVCRSRWDNQLCCLLRGTLEALCLSKSRKEFIQA